jgi:hypothetical protein
MKKLSAWEAWKLLVLSLPKGIGAFVVTVAGLSVGVAASAIVIGIPLLAFALIVCRRMLESEYERTSAWSGRRMPAAGKPKDGDGGPSRERRGLGGLLSVFADRRSYRGVVYGLLQLPAGAVCFTLALLAPLTALALLLAPGVWHVVEARFEYTLFADGWLFEWLTRTFGLTPYEQSWIVGGSGLLLALLVPASVRMLGRFYAAWIEGIAGDDPAPVAEAASVRERSEPEPARLADDAAPEMSPLLTELERLENRLAAEAPRS